MSKMVRVQRDGMPVQAGCRPRLIVARRSMSAWAPATGSAAAGYVAEVVLRIDDEQPGVHGLSFVLLRAFLHEL